MESIVLLLGVIAVCSVGSMTVFQDPPFLNLSAGDSARMSCDMKNVKVGETLHHSWKLHGSWKVLENSSRVTVTPNSLTISSVTPNDSGLYICTVRDNNLTLYPGNGTLLSVTGNVRSVQEIFTRPGSDLLLPIRRHLTLTHPDRRSCHWFFWYYRGSPEHPAREIAEHRYCELSDLRYFPNTRISENGSLIISNVTLENNGIYSVDIEDSAGYRIQRHFYSVHVEEKSRSGMLSGWGHFLSHGAVFVLYTGLLIFIINDLRKMKNEKNRSERRTRRRDQVEMEMEPTYYND